MAFELPNEECIRATRDEMACIRIVLIASSELNYAREDLKQRLSIVPDGNERMNRLADEMTELFKDILGTISDKQRRTLRNSANDYEMRLVPKMTPGFSGLSFTKDDVKTLVSAAREKCKFCTLAGREIHDCDLYGILETYIPLDNYGNEEIVCPYNYQEWADE